MESSVRAVMDFAVTAVEADGMDVEDPDTVMESAVGAVTEFDVEADGRDVGRPESVYSPLRPWQSSTASSSRTQGRRGHQRGVGEGGLGL